MSGKYNIKKIVVGGTQPTNTGTVINPTQTINNPVNTVNLGSYKFKYCGPDIVQNFTVKQVEIISSSTEGDFTVGGDLFNCSGTTYTNKVDPCDPTSGVTISGIVTFLPNPTIQPVSDDTVNLGTTTKRFRDINTISGTSTVWTSTNVVNTPNLNLGLDSDNNSRIITADNSVIQDDIINGGTF